MRIMRIKDKNYTVYELNKYKIQADKFSQIWVVLSGRHGITNYIHMIGSGHTLVYMRRWGNLTKYSQQGWEALNALIKLFFFWRTNKGGKNSGEWSVKKSKLIQIAMLFQRRFFLVCNLVPEQLWTDNKLLENLLQKSEQVINVSTNNLDHDDDIMTAIILISNIVIFIFYNS